jgi:hypothetical protein
MSLLERAVRCAIAAILIAVPSVDLVFLGGTFDWWHAAGMLLSVYPGMTGMLGWDPFYALVGIKTCDLSERNQCGTLPFQIDAALGHHPIPDKDYDHSLGGSHH